MSIASVLIPSDKSNDPAAGSSSGPRYSLLLTTDDALIEAAQRLRYDVFSRTPGFTLPAASDGRDVDRFDEYCDHLLVRDDDTAELVGCYRMLPPAGAIAAGGLYTATEFDVRAFDPLRPSLVEMGRAAVRDGHRNGAVVLLMWAGILAYLDRCDYDYVTGCVSVPVDSGDDVPGCQLRGVRDFVLARHAAPYRVHPYRAVRIGGKALDDIAPPRRATLPPLMRGYLRLGAQVCGEPAHDPAFGVGDFCVLLSKRQADARYLSRLRSVSAASALVGGVA
ncbi:GNAT family N-acetyltransferase [Mycobacterium kansasii]|uniref:Acetyltransferase domain protein n=5 Tax=Mycobacterium kansasii TaxID=1768 RepID=A0A1V3XZR3_MYCKA|nr:GNAT family N-acyltransferase [Mycobacterium kansasii]AGZ52913.1 phosphohistidine phosphatase [Mycobacterium kansasii ATCC 12478]ARG55440.1 phosphohistidine phosphatase [Mycobacterium kansasii]ARG60887.1 phosphohistidine phosphatase [Mycobacterium kansasii]ARG68582.1 phosphohistidine phosphatase [Mycobacterium kansasii]ARG82316.1 phosphohistidine phosphatase [Mycobacterium kansasii]